MLANLNTRRQGGNQTLAAPGLVLQISHAETLSTQGKSPSRAGAPISRSARWETPLQSGRARDWRSHSGLAPGLQTHAGALRPSGLVARRDAVRGLRGRDPYPKHRVEQRRARHRESQSGAGAGTGKTVRPEAGAAREIDSTHGLFQREGAAIAFVLARVDRSA